MARWYIIRDELDRGDVATVWNWQKREWCWDLDGIYAASDGFAYHSLYSVNKRAEALLQAENAYDYRRDRKRYTGIRVVGRLGLVEHLEFDWGHGYQP